MKNAITELHKWNFECLTVDTNRLNIFINKKCVLMVYSWCIEMSMSACRYHTILHVKKNNV